MPTFQEKLRWPVCCLEASDERLRVAAAVVVVAAAVAAAHARVLFVRDEAGSCTACKCWCCCWCCCCLISAALSNCVADARVAAVAIDPILPIVPALSMDDAVVVVAAAAVAAAGLAIASLQDILQGCWRLVAGVAAVAAAAAAPRLRGAVPLVSTG